MEAVMRKEWRGAKNASEGKNANASLALRWQARRMCTYVQVHLQSAPWGLCPPAGTQWQLPPLLHPAAHAAAAAGEPRRRWPRCCLQQVQMAGTQCPAPGRLPPAGCCRLLWLLRQLEQQQREPRAAGAAAAAARVPGRLARAASLRYSRGAGCRNVDQLDPEHTNMTNLQSDTLYKTRPVQTTSERIHSLQPCATHTPAQAHLAASWRPRSQQTQRRLPAPPALHAWHHQDPQRAACSAGPRTA